MPSHEPSTSSEHVPSHSQRPPPTTLPPVNALKERAKHLEQSLKELQSEAQARRHSADRLNEASVQQREELRQARLQLQRAKEAADAANRGAADRRRMLKAAYDTIAQQRPLAVLLSGLPCQWLLSGVIASLGVMGPFGPSSYSNFFQALTGSALGGLAFSSAFAFCSAQVSISLSQQVASLLEGSGPPSSYLLWAMLLFLGLLRWYAGFECALFACVDEVRVNESGAVVGIRGAPRKPRSRTERSRGDAQQSVATERRRRPQRSPQGPNGTVIARPAQ